ncbi:MAG: hypothetical protein ACOYMV_12145 [Verrucomicrobiia bacterium]
MKILLALLVLLPLAPMASRAAPPKKAAAPSKPAKTEAATENLLANASFAEWGEDGLPKGWTLHSAVAGSKACTVAKAADAKRPGKNLVKFILEAADLFTFQQYRVCRDGEKYRATMRYRTVGAAKAYLVIETGPVRIAYDVNAPSPLPQSEEWETAETVFRTPEDASLKSFGVQCRVDGTGEVFMEFITLELLPD